jgi:hypothetical protein
MYQDGIPPRVEKSGKNRGKIGEIDEPRKHI